MRAHAPGVWQHRGAARDGPSADAQRCQPCPTPPAHAGLCRRRRFLHARPRGRRAFRQTLVRPCQAGLHLHSAETLSAYGSCASAHLPKAPPSMPAATMPAVSGRRAGVWQAAGAGCEGHRGWGPPCMRLAPPAGVALFANSARSGLVLFGPGTKPGAELEAAPAGWRGVFSGGFPAGQTLCFVRGWCRQGLGAHQQEGACQPYRAAVLLPAVPRQCRLPDRLPLPACPAWPQVEGYYALPFVLQVPAGAGRQATGRLWELAARGRRCLKLLKALPSPTPIPIPTLFGAFPPSPGTSHQHQHQPHPGGGCPQGPQRCARGSWRRRAGTPPGAAAARLRRDLACTPVRTRR